MLAKPRLRTAGPPVAASVVLLAVYASTMAPGLAGGDTPEMITAAVHVGVPHQPGYPLYTLLGRLLALVPVGSAAFRVTLLSVLPAALAGGVLARLLGRWRVPPAVAALLPIAAGLAWITWSQAVVAEVYALGLLLMLWALDRMDRWRTSGSGRDLLVAAFAGGLAISHQPLAIMLLPGALVLVGLRARASRRVLRLLPGAAALFVLPFTAYLLLPIRSAAPDAVVDYARIQDAGDFFYHALGRASSSELLGEGGAGVGRTLALIGDVALHSAGPLTLLLVGLGLVGGVRLARRDRERLLLVGTPIVLLLGFSLVYAILDVENYLILPLWLLAAAAGCALMPPLPRGPGARVAPAVAVALLALVLSAFVGNRARCDRSSFHLVDDFTTSVLASVPANGALFLYTEVLVGPFAYHTSVEGRRPDVRLVDMTGKVLEQPFGFERITGDWREGRWRRMEALFADPPAELAGRPFTTLMFEARAPREGIEYRRRGLLVELVHDGDPSVPPVDPGTAWREIALREPSAALLAHDRTAFSLTPTIQRIHRAAGLRTAEGLLARGEVSAAIDVYRDVLRLSPDHVAAREALALAYVRTGRTADAERELRRVAEENPRGTQALNAIGVIVLQRGEADSAEVFFRRALERDATAPLTHFNLGMLLARDPSRSEDALRHLEEFLRLAPGDPDAGVARETIGRLTRRRP